jgi:transposase
MLLPQQEIHFSSFSALYDLVIPKEHLLRKINELVDFSFIYEELKNKYCHSNGRTAACPVRMFKYLLLKVIYTISDVDVVERSRYDMSFKYFLLMTPEESVIDSTTLTKFRKLRLEDADLLNLLIQKTVTIAIEKGIIKAQSIIVDATHTLAKSNPFSSIEVLRERSKILRKTVYTYDEKYKESMPRKNDENDLEKELAYCKQLEETIENDLSISEIPAIREKLNWLKETVEDTQEQLIFSKDSEAKIGHKSADSSFFGYKTHIAMSEERIITAAIVTSGEKGDGPQLPKLLAISQQNGINVDTIIGDAAYSGKDNLNLAKEQNIKIVAKLNPAITRRG